MKTILVVGPSVPSALLKNKEVTIIHKPCIDLCSLPIEKKLLQEKLCISDGILFTSKHAVSAFATKIEKLRLLPLFCIGEETCHTALTHFPHFQCLTAKEPTQEGMVRTLLAYKKEHALAALLWPRSAEARPYLKKEMTQASIKVYDFFFYTPKILPQSYCFDSVDEIFFTCPSSVKAFFTLVEKKDIAGITLTAIGPITKKILVSIIT